MTTTYEKLRSVVFERAAAFQMTPGTAAMQTMTLGVSAMAPDLPRQLLGELVAAEGRWLTHAVCVPGLENARVAAWRFLEAKNGNSTMIRDRVDLAVRALICVLWDYPDEGVELEDGLEFFAQLAERYGGLERALGLSGPEVEGSGNM